MKRKTKKITSLLISFSMLAAYGIQPSSVFAKNGNGEASTEIVELESSDPGIMPAAEGDTYSCNFKQLIKDGAETVYGKAEDIIQLDEYTTANLTYSGTYITADGALYLMGGNAGKGSYTKGSYIEFTAPSAGTVSYTGTYVNYFVDGTYVGYKDTASEELKEGQKFQIGQRVNERSTVTSLTFTPAAEPTPDPSLVNGYTEGNYNGMPYRISIPSEQGEYPLAVYLHGSDKNGTDNMKQLMQAQYLFDKLKDKYILVAPQTADTWQTDSVAGLLDSIANVNTDKIYVMGQNEGADAAMEIAATNPAKVAAVIASAPTSVLTDEQAAALSSANTAVYTFSEYTSMENARANVNKLQSSKMTDVMYTEYPYAEENIAETAANTTGISDWLLAQSLTDNAKEKTESRVVDLAIFMGQSNMSGRGEYADAIECAPGHGFEYHSVTEPGVLTTVAEPFGKHENNDAVNDSGSNGIDRRSGDMVSSFMESYYQTSGTPLVGVQCSRGGTESKWWNSSDRMTEASSRYNEAKAYLEASGYTIGKQFMVWCQGCSDADSSRNVETYKSNTKSIFEAMKTRTGLTDMFMIRIGHCKTSGAAAIDEVKDPRYKAINLAQKELADATDGITAVASLYTDEYAALMRDQYHYHQPAYNSVGTIAGNNSAYTLYNKGTWTSYPEPSDEPDATPIPAEGTFEITSSDPSIDVSGLKSYSSTSYRMYKADGSYETVSAVNGKIANSTGGEVVIVPEYKFEFTNQSAPTDKNISGYAKVGQGSYSEEKGYGLTSENYSINENGCRPDTNPIKVDLAEGFYDITVYRLGGCRADIYTKGRLIANNTTSSGSQNRGGSSALMEIPGVKLWDGSADITFGNLSGSSERIASLKIVRVPEKFRKPVIWIAGDSEAANYYPIDANGSDLESNKIMMTGFGQQLSKLMSDKYSVSNYGQPSATVKTWYDECMDSVNELMQPGDTILIDFGINDAISSSNKMSVDEMKAQMKVIIDAAKDKNVTPILVSPIYNGKYQHKSYFTYSTDSDTNSMYAFAAENNVECIDLNKWTQLYVKEAAEKTGDTSWQTNNYHIADNLHLTQYSAVLAASIIAAGMSEIGYETSDYSLTYKDIAGVLDGNLRGEETGVTRIYSVDEMKQFMGISSLTTPTPPVTSAPSKQPVSLSYDEADKKLTLTSTDASLNSAQVIKVAYNDNGTISGMAVYPAAFANNKAVIDNIDITGDEKVYVWDSINNMKPLSEVFKVSSKPSSSPSVTPTASPTPEPTNSPLFARDFENGDITGWKQSNGGINSIKEDSNSKIGKYMNQQGGGGGSRAVEYKFSSPFKDNFVFEADIKAVSTNEFMANISLLGSSTTVNSTGTNNVPVDGLILKVDVPTNEKRFLLNNENSSKGSTLSSITGKKLLSTEFPAGSWVHIRAIGNFEDQTTKIQLTSLDGNTVYFDGKADMYEGKGNKITDLQRIYIVAPRPNENYGVDNIVIRKANNSELAEAANFHNIKIVNRSTTYDYYSEHNKPVNELYLPDVSVYGSAFLGWSVNGSSKTYTTAELLEYPITSDSTISAVVDSAYIENAVNVSFANFPTDSRLIMSADANGTDFKDNPISLKIQGETGTDLAANPDERANPEIKWEFTGFYTMHGEPTTDDKTTSFPGTKQYCDSYAKVTVDSSYQPEVSFALRNTSENYYGKVKATVTYNNKTFIVEKSLIILADTSQKAGQILPKPGYVSDFNLFEDGLEGDYSSDKTLLGGWNVAGSNSTNKLGIGKDSSGKYMRISKNEKKDSSYFYNEISTTTEQLIFDQDIRFNTPVASIYYKGEDATSFKKNQSAFTALYQNGVLSLNGQNVAENLSTETWYHLVLSAAVSSQKCWAKVYTADGKLLGESAVTPFANESVMTPYVYAYRLNDKSNAASSVDINALTIKKAEIDPAKYSMTIDQINMTIPDNDTAATVNASISAKTTDGYESIGKAVWSIADDTADGVTVTANEDTHTAVISVSKDAAAGTVPIRATIDGKSVTGEIVLTGTRESVAFVNKPKSILIPSSGNTTAECAAVVRDGQGQNVSGRPISYALESPVNGVNVNASTGEITVSSGAKASQAVIVATAQNNSGQPITRKAAVTIYSLDFGFGSGSPESGQTMVTANTLYDESFGFGIEGTASSENGYLSGDDLVFKVNVEPGKVYQVTVSYEGNLSFEKYNQYLTGIKKDTNSSLTSKTYKVAVVGDGETIGKGVMDINLPGNGKLASVKITQLATPSAGAKPVWIEIGDSTVAQNPSWGYVLAGKWQSYPELANAIEGFKNKGRGARQLTSFYNEGLLDGVLQEVRPGDVVSISGMGTNGYDGTIEDFKAQLNYYIDSVIEMGGKVILGSYTPNGNWGSYKGRVYNAQTETFAGKRYNDYDVALYEVYQSRKDDANILGYVDIGAITDELMTAEVKKARDAAGGTGEAADAAAAARADELLKWYPNDFNHYTGELSNLILPEVTKQIAALIKK